MSEIYEEERPGRVVVGLDRSDDSWRAARWAACEARSRAVPLSIVHALHLSNGAALPLEPTAYATRARAEGGKLLDEAAQRIVAEFPDLEVRIELSDLSPTQTLSTLSHDAALLVTGTRGHGGFTGMLLGSVSRRLAAHAHSPLVVVRGDQPTDTIDEVVVGVEPREPSAPLRFAFATAQRHGAVLHAVRAWQSSTNYPYPTAASGLDVEHVRAEEHRDVEDLLAPMFTAFPDVKVQISASRGNTVPILIESARGTRLVVVGAHRHHGPLSVGAGYVVEGLLAHSPTPVAVVPAHRSAVAS